jgi:hypothetical protein
VITGVAGALLKQQSNVLRHLVCVDALVPRPSESSASLMPPTLQRRAGKPRGKPRSRRRYDRLLGLLSTRVCPTGEGRLPPLVTLRGTA